MKIYISRSDNMPQTHYCTYFNYKTNNFSDNGTSTFLTRLDEHGNGLVVCTSKHCLIMESYRMPPLSIYGSYVKG